MENSIKLLTLLVIIFISTTGCQVVDQSRVQDADSDNILWNTRAGWEGSVIGVPY